MAKRIINNSSIPPEDRHISTQAIARLIKVITPDRIIDKIEEMLEATYPNGQPDWRSQESACKLWMAYAIGLPVQRQEIIQHNITTPPVDQLLGDTASVEALIRVISANPDGKALLLNAASKMTPDEKVSV